MKDPPRGIIVVNDNGDFNVIYEDLVTNPVSTPPTLSNQQRRSRSISTASSHTMRADTPEVQLELSKVDSRPAMNPKNGKRVREAELSHDHDRRTRRVRPRFDGGIPSKQNHGQNVIDLTEEIIDLIIKEPEAGLKQKVSNKIPPPGSGSRHKQPFQRNAPLEAPLAQVEQSDWKGISIKSGTVLELEDGEFIQVKIVIRNLETDETRLRGFLIKRCTKSRGMLNYSLNEAYYILEIDQNDSRLDLEQCMVEVGLDDLLKHRDLICTNEPRKKCPFEDPGTGGTNKEKFKHIREHGQLHVRWKYIRIWANARDRFSADKKPNRCVEGEMSRLKEKSECTAGRFRHPEELRTEWRGKTVCGGSGTQSRGVKKRGPVYHEHDPDLGRLKRIKDIRSHLQSELSLDDSDKQYSFGDTFSGGGGSTRAAVEAGLALKYVMDGNEDCMPTLAANFPHANIYHLYSNEFSTLHEDLTVDVLHISEPCQPWSPNHTKSGKDDEKNIASFFSVRALLRKCRPRIVTVEQTFGIKFPRFEEFFNNLVNDFTSQGYSIKWRIVKFQELGLPQSRKRLIMIAAGPGDTLPDFPLQTHTDNPTLFNDPRSGLKPYTMPASVLRNIPHGTANHNIHTIKRGHYPGWDASKIAGTICTNGGFYYPDGTRYLTNREFARLQGFPDHHVFIGTDTEIRKQIGNAVPPSVFKIFFELIIEHLRKTDQLELSQSFIDLTGE